MPNFDDIIFIDEIRRTSEIPFTITTEYSPELISKLVTSKTTGVDACYHYCCDVEERTCEVCGEPINELSRHICDKCLTNAKKYKDALKDREVAFGG